MKAAIVATEPAMAEGVEQVIVTLQVLMPKTLWLEVYAKSESNELDLPLDG